MPPKEEAIHDAFLWAAPLRGRFRRIPSPEQAVKWLAAGEPVHLLPNPTQNRKDRSEFLFQSEYTLHFAFTVTIAPSAGHFHAIIII